MEIYMNLGNASGVSSYGIGEDFIIVVFSTGKPYRYSYGKAGRMHVEKMKELAKNGRGLNSYINKYVRNDYD